MPAFRNASLSNHLRRSRHLPITSAPQATPAFLRCDWVAAKASLDPKEAEARRPEFCELVILKTY